MRQPDALDEPWVHADGGAGEPAVVVEALGGAHLREWARAWMGDRHRLLGAALTGGLGRRIGADVVAFERSTHFAPSEEPERFNRLLRETWTAAAGAPAP